MKDIIEMVVECQSKTDDAQKVRLEFCNKLLNELKKMKGEDLALHLKDTSFNTHEQKINITLSF